MQALIDDWPFFFLLQSKEAFVSEAKDVIANCQAVTQFIRVIADHCLDKQCTEELSLIVDQILTITNQLSIISRSEKEDFFKTKNRFTIVRNLFSFLKNNFFFYFLSTQVLML